MACFTPTPDPRSASRPRRHSPRRWPCFFCLQFIWDRFAATSRKSKCADISASCLSRSAELEISIASTKAFTAQMAVLFLFAVYLGQVRGNITKEQVRRYIRELLEQICRARDQHRVHEGIHRADGRAFSVCSLSGTGSRQNHERASAQIYPRAA